VQERLEKEHRAESEQLRREIISLMEENHRYQRDMDRLARESEQARAQMREAEGLEEARRGEEERRAAERELLVARLEQEIETARIEVKRMGKQVREGDCLRRELIETKDMLTRAEYEKVSLRDKAAGLERRVEELSDLLNLEL
jgi:hypothetical protein